MEFNTNLNAVDWNAVATNQYGLANKGAKYAAQQPASVVPQQTSNTTSPSFAGDTFESSKAKENKKSSGGSVVTAAVILATGVAAALHLYKKGRLNVEGVKELCGQGKELVVEYAGKAKDLFSKSVDAVKNFFSKK